MAFSQPSGRRIAVCSTCAVLTLNSITTAASGAADANRSAALVPVLPSTTALPARHAPGPTVRPPARGAADSWPLGRSIAREENLPSALSLGCSVPMSYTENGVLMLSRCSSRQVAEAMEQSRTPPETLSDRAALLAPLCGCMVYWRGTCKRGV